MSCCTGLGQGTDSAFRRGISRQAFASVHVNGEHGAAAARQGVHCRIARWCIRAVRSSSCISSLIAWMILVTYRSKVLPPSSFVICPLSRTGGGRGATALPGGGRMTRSKVLQPLSFVICLLSFPSMVPPITEV